MPDDPVMIVVGAGAVALTTVRELCALQGHRVVVLWPSDPEFAAAVEALGAVFVADRPDTAEGLERAEVRRAVTILALSRDEQLNLHAALLARDANPEIRIVLRQFSRRLARKIEQNLPDCSVLSLAWHSAATFAAAAVDATCFRGLQFPQPDGPLTGFALRNADSCGVGGRCVGEAETMLAARIVAADGVTPRSPGAIIGESTELIVYGSLAELQRSAPRRSVVRHRDRAFLGPRLRALWSRGNRRTPRLNPILSRLAIAALGCFVAGAAYFHAVFGDDWLEAAYFVLATMTTTGYGDVTPNRNDPVEIIAAMLLMLAGIILTGLFIAFGASLLTRIHWITMQGLRPVRRHGHIVVCGAGSIGSGVIELLLALGRRLVVIEQNPDSAIVELARERRFDLLTGDASRDETLDLCNLEAAHSLVALTNVDTLNLEIALGGRARNPTLPIVLRIAEAGFAASIARHFEFETTFSAEGLAAPAFVALSRFPGSRGRVAFADQEFALAEYAAGRDLQPSPPDDAVLLAITRNSEMVLAADFAELRTGDRALMMIPLAPFRDGRDTLAAAAARFVAGGGLAAQDC